MFSHTVDFLRSFKVHVLQMLWQCKRLLALCTTHSEKSTMLLQNSWFNHRRELQIGLRYKTTEMRCSKTRKSAGGKLWQLHKWEGGLRCNDRKCFLKEKERKEKNRKMLLIEKTPLVSVLRNNPQNERIAA